MTPLISAHCGGAIEAGIGAAERYRSAIELGVDFIEFDVRRTKDRVAIICHDERTASGRAIRDFAYDELTGELGGEALTLEELLELAAGRVGLHLDLKEPGYESEIVATTLQRCPLEKLVITSKDAEIRTIKERFPAVCAGLSIGEDLQGASPCLTLGVRLGELFPHARIERSHADFVAAHRRLAEVNLLRYCSRRRIPVWVWTVDDERGLARFIADRRVTSVITNRPELALRLRSA